MSIATKDHFNQELQNSFEEKLEKQEFLHKNTQRRTRTDSYILFHQRFKGQKLYEFFVYGKMGKYKPVFTISDNNIFSSCNCRDGRKDKMCGHRSMVLLGDERKFSNPKHLNSYAELSRDFKDARVQNNLLKEEYPLPVKASFFKEAVIQLNGMLNIF